MIEILRKLIAIPSFSGEESAAADCLQQEMAALGLDVHRVGNNLWVEAEAPSDKPVLLLNAHIDTVKPAAEYSRDPFEPTLDGDTLYGLGSNDDGGSLIALLRTFMALKDKAEPYRLIFSATAEEETGGRGGIELIFPQIGEVTLGIMGEPTGMQMAVSEKSLMVLDCTARGKSGHAAREEGINAIYKAMADIETLRSFSFPKQSEYLGKVKMSVTMINAGTQHNVIPGECSFVVDVRGNGEYSNAQMLEIIEGLVECEVKPRSLRLNGSSIAKSHPVVRKGLSLGLGAFGSPTLSNQSLCPFTTLKIGPGESSRSHTADEFIKLSEIDRAVEIYTALLDGLDITQQN